MLILSRRRGETIHIGNRITLKVVEVRGDKVRLGIDAPEDVQVRRDDAKEAGPREP